MHLSFLSVIFVTKSIIYSVKTRTPYTRDDLRIKRSDRVLEVGPGHNPTYRSNVICEKFLHNNAHRCGDVKVYPHQTLVNADGEHLPFQDKEFDYVICNQVLEHTENPARFLDEQARVAKRGYIETPSYLGEFLHPKASHKWAILEIDNKLVLFEKAHMAPYAHDYGNVFLNYLPYQSLVYKVLQIIEPQLTANRYEWEGKIDYLVNPEDEYYRSFFTKPWTMEMTRKIFPPRGAWTEIKRLFIGLWFVFKGQLSKLHRRTLWTIEEYEKHHSSPSPRT